MLLRLLPLPLLVLTLAACNGTRGLSDADGPPVEAEASEGAPMGGDGIVGTWELVEQEGYPEDQPDVMQRLTFYEDGRMVFATEVDGEAIEQEMQYRLEGDQLVQVSGVGAPAARASRWSLDGDRLVIEQPETGQRDIYRRVR